jgi:hypothetical protein
LGNTATDVPPLQITFPTNHKHRGLRKTRAHPVLVKEKNNTSLAKGGETKICCAVP